MGPLSSLAHLWVNRNSQMTSDICFLNFDRYIFEVIRHPLCIFHTKGERFLGLIRNEMGGRCYIPGSILEWVNWVQLHPSIFKILKHFGKKQYSKSDAISMLSANESAHIISNALQRPCTHRMYQ